MILVGLLFGWFILTTAADKLRSKSWPVARAEVVDLDTHRQAKSDVRCVALRYRYVVDNKVYVADRMTPAQASLCYRNREAAEAFTRRYQPGAQLSIRYDPSNPRKAAVYPSDLGFMDVLFCFLSVLVAVAGFLILKNVGRAPEDVAS